MKKILIVITDCVYVTEKCVHVSMHLEEEEREPKKKENSESTVLSLISRILFLCCNLPLKNDH